MGIDPKCFVTKVSLMEYSEQERKIQEALREGQLDCVRAFFTQDHPQQSLYKRSALVASIQQGNIPIALEILHMGGLDAKGRYYAIYEAIKTGQLDLLSELIIDDESRQNAFRIAVNANQKELALELLVAHPLICENLAGVIDDCLDEDRIELAIELYRRANRITEGQRGDMLRKAISKHQPEFALEIFNGGSITKEYRSSCLSFAILTGKRIAEDAQVVGVDKKYVDLALALLSSGPILSFDAGVAVKFSWQAGDVSLWRELANVFLERGILDRSSIVDLVGQAASLDHLDFARELIAAHHLNDQELAESTAFCIQVDRIDFARELLARAVIITEEHRVGIMQIAINHHYPEFAREILPIGPIQDSYRGQLFELAIRAGMVLANFRDVNIDPASADLLEALIQSGPIPLVNVLEAFNYAVDDRNEFFCQIIRDRFPDYFRAPQVAPGYLPAAQAAPSRLFVKKSELSANPALFLQRASEGFSGVTFLNEDGTAQEGVDAGGLTKSFVSLLSNALKEHELIKFDDKRIPTLSRESAVNYSNLGRLLSVLDAKNTERPDKILMGPLFSKETFGLLQTLLNPALDEKGQNLAFALACGIRAPENVREFLNAKAPSEAQIASMMQYQTEVTLVDCSEKTAEELKELCMEEFRPSLRALRAIASGLSPELIAKIMVQGVAYANELLGNETPTAEELIAKLCCTDESVAEQVSWIREKIEEESANPASTWIKRFLMCTTSQSVLPSGNITIRGIDGVVCRSHTCFNQLDLPISQEAPHIEDPSLTPKERFLANLEILLSETNFHMT